MDGFLCIDKPRGMTSFDVVRAVRNALKERRVGHAGTLDPAATGVLVLALGKWTRLLPFIPSEPKEYEFSIRFGIETDTLDETGREIAHCNIVPSEDILRQTMKKFMGIIMQSPPRYSAVRIAGQRAYIRARRNEDFQTTPRPVHIYDLHLLSFDSSHAVARCRVRCSGGTYVRSLAADIARHLGTCAHAADIRRTAVGRFRAENALPLAATVEQMRSALLSPEQVFEPNAQLKLSDSHVKHISYGRPIREITCDGTKVKVAFSITGNPVAVLQSDGLGWWKPVRVFISPTEARGK